MKREKRRRRQQKKKRQLIWCKRIKGNERWEDADVWCPVVPVLSGKEKRREKRGGEERNEEEDRITWEMHEVNEVSLSRQEKEEEIEWGILLSPMKILSVSESTVIQTKEACKKSMPNNNHQNKVSWKRPAALESDSTWSRDHLKKTTRRRWVKENIRQTKTHWILFRMKINSNTSLSSSTLSVSCAWYHRWESRTDQLLSLFQQVSW